MKASRLIFLTALIILFVGSALATTIPLGDPPGITIRRGSEYSEENPVVQTLTLASTDGFGFSETAFKNTTEDTTFLSASFLLTLASGFLPGNTECDTAPAPDGLVFPFCTVTPEGPNSVLVTFSTEEPGLARTLFPDTSGIHPGDTFEIILNGGASSTCEPTSDPRTQCGFLDNHVYSGQVSTSSTPPSVPEPGTMALILTGLGAVAARRRSRKRS